ncbi:MAG: hypothetical protein M1352_01500 [Patescibacteria group bacterium]|nr:hypothetical protein [Patescibacteria group bacterium]
MPQDTVNQASVGAENPSGKVLLEWESPSRVFIRKDDKYIRTVLLTLLAIGLVLIFFQQFLLYAVFLSLAFVSFVLRTVPPEKINHKITEYGLTSANHNYLWKELKDFWFTRRGDFLVLNVNTNLRFPPRLFMLIGPDNSAVTKELLISTLSLHLSFRELPPDNAVDKMLDSFSQKFSLT